MLGLDQPLHRDRAQVGGTESVAGFERFRRRRRNAVAEAGGAFEEPKENRLAGGAQRAGFLHREQWIVERGALFHHDQFAADHIGAGARLARKPRHGGIVGTQLGGALEAALCVAKSRFGAEIGARGHRRGNSHGELFRATCNKTVIPGRERSERTRNP